MLNVVEVIGEIFRVCVHVNKVKIRKGDQKK